MDIIYPDYMQKIMDDGVCLHSNEAFRRSGASSYSVWLDILSWVEEGRSNYKPKTATMTQNGRARRLGVIGQISEVEWQALLEKYNRQCLCCGSKKEHLHGSYHSIIQGWNKYSRQCSATL